MKELYAIDVDFSAMYDVCERAAFQKLYKHNGFLF